MKKNNSLAEILPIHPAVNQPRGVSSYLNFGKQFESPCLSQALEYGSALFLKNIFLDTSILRIVEVFCF